MKLPDLQFGESVVKECDFIDANLENAAFCGCDLEGSQFSHTTLTNADFTSAKNYRIDPRTNQLAAAKFSLPEAIALLEMMEITVE